MCIRDRYLFGASKSWEEVKLPADIAANVPDVKGDTERNWRSLICDLVNDINGEPVGHYQSFKEGSQYQQLIDIIRQNDSWVDVRHLQ